MSKYNLKELIRQKLQEKKDIEVSEETTATDVASVESPLMLKRRQLEEEIKGIDDFNDTNNSDEPEDILEVDREELKEILDELDDDEISFMAEAMFNALADIEELYDVSDEDGYSFEELPVSDIDNGKVEELLFNRTHTRNLRKERRKTSWKRDALKRKKFRKTGEGRASARRAALYQKKYRKAHKAKLKKYDKEYNASSNKGSLRK